ncbi:hypothetical protein Tco_0445308 [Tanacetum coccineum]
MVKSWLVQDQTVLGKDYSNLLIADSLLKTIWFINAPCYGNEALASPKANELTIPEQTATGKGTSNPFMADSAYTISIHSQCFYIVNLYSYKLAITLSRLQRSVQFRTHRVVELYFVNTEYQLADIFTKALCRERIKFLINKLGMRSFTPKILKHLADEVEE